MWVDLFLSLRSSDSPFISLIFLQQSPRQPQYNNSIKQKNAEEFLWYNG